MFPSATVTSPAVIRGGFGATRSDQLLIVPGNRLKTSSVQVPWTLSLSTAESGVSGLNVPVNGGDPPPIGVTPSSENTVSRNCVPIGEADIGTSDTDVPAGEISVTFMNPTSSAVMLIRTSRSAIPRSSVTVMVERVTASGVSAFGVSAELKIYWSPIENLTVY